MHASRFTAGWNRRSFARVARTGWVLAAAALSTALPTFAGDEPEGDAIHSAPSQATSRNATEADDEFLPITKVVPRAKIVLRAKERLPDRDADKTFAAFGAWDVSPSGNGAESTVPMYPFGYHPLYFEDMNLERCGWTCGCCVQPVVSGLYFFGTVAILPYKMLVSPPCSYVCPPGECPLGYRFDYCENYIGPRPDFSKVCDKLYGYGSFLRRANCR